MAVDVIMPKWGHTMEEGKVTLWLKQEGDTVVKGEELFEVETEKITNRVEAPADGTLFQILVPAGSTVPVGAVVALLAESGETPARVEGGAAKPENTARAEAHPEEVPAAADSGGEKAFVRATPAARRAAKDAGIDLQQVRGSGPEGRVTEADVRQYQTQAPAAARITPLAAEMARQAGMDPAQISGTGDGGKITAADVERTLGSKVTVPPAAPAGTIPFTGMRKSIADNMQASLLNTAQLTAFTEVDVTETVKFRDLARRETAAEDSVRISFNDIFILAVSRALKRHPIMNSTLIDNEILLHDAVHMGIAVALPEGLIVPVLKDADRKGLRQIARESRELIAKARAAQLSVDEVTGGTFTITNLSMFAVDGITPILRPPETGILAFGRIKSKPSVFDGEIAIRSLMTVCLTFDHRVVDGAPASQFLQTLSRYLEEPTLILT